MILLGIISIIIIIVMASYYIMMEDNSKSITFMVLISLGLIFASIIYMLPPESTAALNSANKHVLTKYKTVHIGSTTISIKIQEPRITGKTK